MIEREEVEALLAAVDCDDPWWFTKTEMVVIADLCRAWLAVNEATVRNVVGGQWDDVFAREGNVVWCSDLRPGQRVRIVKEVG